VSILESPIADTFPLFKPLLIQEPEPLRFFRAVTIALKISKLLFETPWVGCTLTLRGGTRIRIAHPDFLLMPPHRQWVMHVPNEEQLQLIPVDQIASVTLKRRSRATR
jgi:hypothetical protein